MKIYFYGVRETKNPGGIEKVAKQLAKHFQTILMKQMRCNPEIYISKPSNHNLIIYQKLSGLLRLIFHSILNRRKIKDYDVFFSPTSRLPLFLPSTKLKVIVVHDLVYKRVPKTMNWMHFLADAILTPFAIRNSDLIFVPSESTANDIAQFFNVHKNKVVNVKFASCMNVECFDDKCLPKSPFFLMASNVDKRKNIIMTLEAFKIYKTESGSDAKLIISGGKGNDFKRVNAWIKSNKLSESVIILNYVTDAIMASLYKNCIALLYTSLYEGFGLPILEAHQFSKAVIGSDTSSIPEILGDGGIIVSPVDTSGTAKAMIALHYETHYARVLEKKALKNSSLFCWENSSKLIFNVCQISLKEKG